MQRRTQIMWIFMTLKTDGIFADKKLAPARKKNKYFWEIFYVMGKISDSDPY